MKPKGLLGGTFCLPSITLLEGRSICRYVMVPYAQEASKNDSYCWVCHDGGDVLCCDKCARVFHVQCSGLQRAPEGDEEWFCPVCKVRGRPVIEGVN